MAKPAGSLESMMRERIATQAEPATGAAKSRPAQVAAPAPDPSKPPIDKVSLYVPKAAHKFLKQVALDMDRRPHDLFMEGVDLVLRQHGKSLKDFTGG